MENEKVFTYQYSAAQNREVEQIRRRYLPREESGIDRLRRLDERVRCAGMIEALTLGIVGCLIFGIGMCWGLGVFGEGAWPAIPFCTVGILAMIPAYPLYRRISRRTRERLAPEILRLSEDIMSS